MPRWKQKTMVAKTMYEKLGRTAAVTACALIVAVAVFAFLGLALAANTNATDVLADYATDIPLSEEAQLALDDASTAEDASEVGQNDDEPLADGVTAPEASEERPDGQPSASVSEGDQGAGSADEGRAYSLRLLVKASAESIRAEDTVLGEHEGVHLLGFADEAALAAAEEYYASAAEWCERDIPMGVSEGEAPEGDPAPVSAEDNALALLEDAEAEPVGTPAGKLLVALIDTGAPSDASVLSAASVIDDNPYDSNGHASAMLSAMQQEDAGIQVISVKALGDDGTGSASSVYAAIEYAIEARADVINLSLAGRASYGNAAIADAVNDALAAGIVVVAAAGNGGYDAGSFTPANVPGVITVGACDEEGNPLESSNRGAMVDFYVVADSTSAAAARVSGWLSANGAADDGWQDRLAAEDWAFTDIDAEGDDVTDPASDDVNAAATYTNALTLNDGTGVSGSVTYDTSTKRFTPSSVGVPTKTNWAFQGFYRKNSAHSKVTDYRGNITVSSANYTNGWEAGWCQLILEDNGGSGGNGYLYPVRDTLQLYRDAALSQSMSSGSNPTTKPTRTGGYVFQGYYAAATSLAKIIDANGYFVSKVNNSNVSEAPSLRSPSQSKKIYARWGRIVLNDNSGSGGQGYIYPLYGTGVYADAGLTRKMTTGSTAVTIPTRPGYRFDGYYTTATGGYQYIDKNGVLTSTGYSNMGDSSNTSWSLYDKVLYARWTEAPWTITLDSMGGTDGTQYVYTANGRGSLSGIFLDLDGNQRIDSPGTYRVTAPKKPYQSFLGYYRQPYHQGVQMIAEKGNNTGNFNKSTFSSNATLYAAYQGIRIAINKQSGSGGDSGPFYEMYGEQFSTNQYGSTSNYTRIVPPGRTNYVFMGYFTGQNGSGTQVTDQNGNIIVSNTYFKNPATLYAFWKPEYYTVTLDSQGADINDGTSLLYTVYNQGIYTDFQFTNAVSSTIPITIPQRSGYVFQGYYTQQQTSLTSTRGNQCIQADGTLAAYFTNTRFRKPTTLYAQWKVAPHTVYLDDQGGTDGTGQVYEMASVGVALDYAMTQKITGSGSGARNPVRKPKKPYQTFNGYYSQQYGRGSCLLTDDGYRTSNFNGYFFTSDATIYAYWTGFRITLNVQGGGRNGGPATIYSFYNEKYATDIHGELSKVITSIAQPTKTGYTFMGYYTQQNGAGTQIIDDTGSIVAPTTFFTSDATIYAYWAPENHTITLDNNGADTGFEGTDAIYELYGTGVYSDPTFAASSIMSNTTNPITMPQKTGKVFRGYYTNETNGNGSGTQRIDYNGYVRFSPTTYRQDVTLHARWLDAPFVISLDDQGGAGGSGQVYELYGDGVFIDQACRKLMGGGSYPVTVPTKTDRVFAGYWTAPNGGGTIKINERGYRQSFPNTFFTSDDTIYAFWRGYAITLNDQGGRSGSGTIYEHYGVDFYADAQETTTISAVAVPTRGNYVFRGYYTGTGGSGTRLIDENGNYESIMTNTYYTADTTLYAYWTPAVYTIDLDAQGADVGLEGTPEVYEQYSVGVYNDAPLSNTMTATMNPITVPQKQFAKFGGYYTRAGGSGTKRIDENGYKTNYFSSTTYTSDDVLYAYWKPLTITLDDQGGSGGSGAIYEEYGVAFYRYINQSGKMTASSYAVSRPTMRYHVFKGYYAQPNGGGVCVIDSTCHIASTADPTMFTDDATIYAYWEYHLDLPVTGGEGTNTTVLWLAALGVVLGGACVLGRRYLAEAAAANRPGKHAKQPIGRHAKR